MTNYRHFFGPSVIFISPNLADTRNPLMLLTYQGVDSTMDSALTTPEMLNLRDMGEIIAGSPDGLTIFYRAIMAVFFEVV